MATSRSGSPIVVGEIYWVDLPSKEAPHFCVVTEAFDPASAGDLAIYLDVQRWGLAIEVILGTTKPGRDDGIDYKLKYYKGGNNRSNESLRFKDAMKYDTHFNVRNVAIVPPSMLSSLIGSVQNSTLVQLQTVRDEARRQRTVSDRRPFRPVDK